MSLIVLRATCDTFDRIYEMWLGKGLFGTWVVIVAHGSADNKALTQRTYSFPTKQEAQAYVDKMVRAKMNSQKRIGADYKIVHKS